MNEPFSVAFVRPAAFGTLAGIHLPAGVEAVTEDVLARLHPDERALALGMRGRRQIEFTGGRLAWRALGVSAEALGVAEEGGPSCPAGLSVSLTHKQDLAVAMAGSLAHGTLGLDLEGDARERMTIASRVLRPDEPAGDWRGVLIRFALKEAAYKAIHPHLRRFVGFQEARVGLDPVTVEIVTEPSLRLEAAWEALDEFKVLAMVRATSTATTAPSTV